MLSSGCSIPRCPRVKRWSTSAWSEKKSSRRCTAFSRIGQGQAKDALGEAGIWITVILIGVLALGVREYARTSGTFAARLEQVKTTILAGTLILLRVTAAVLTVLFIIVVVLVEIWRPLLVA